MKSTVTATRFTPVKKLIRCFHRDSADIGRASNPARLTFPVAVSRLRKERDSPQGRGSWRWTSPNFWKAATTRAGTPASLTPFICYAGQSIAAPRTPLASPNFAGTIGVSTIGEYT